MRASKKLRHRAQMIRTRYAVRLLVSEVLPQLVDSMRTIADTQRIQADTMRRHLRAHEPIGRSADE